MVAVPDILPGARVTLARKRNTKGNQPFGACKVGPTEEVTNTVASLNDSADSSSNLVRRSWTTSLPVHYYFNLTLHLGSEPDPLQSTSRMSPRGSRSIVYQTSRYLMKQITLQPLGERRMEPHPNFDLLPML